MKLKLFLSIYAFLHLDLDNWYQLSMFTFHSLQRFPHIPTFSGHLVLVYSIISANTGYGQVKNREGGNQLRVLALVLLTP